MSLSLKLREALQRKLDGPPLLEGDAVDATEDESGSSMPAAVLVAIVDRTVPTMILTVRPATMRRHAGQIAFPGGRIDAGDRDAVDAALREAEEEIGLPRAEVEVIGSCSPYRTVTGFEVTPVIGVVPPGLSLVPHAAEVEAIFEAPLAYLLDPQHQIVRTVDWRGRARCYYEIQWQDRRIWGATAAMIVNLSRRLALAP
jgi:8-oxo-dGTP pyrophosphatase MutT (NUDIX family)